METSETREFTGNENIMVIVNRDRDLATFRDELIVGLIENKYHVIIVSPDGDTLQRYREMGCDVVIQYVNRHGTNIIQDGKLIKNYITIIKRYMPRCVLTFTIKPNLYAGIACRVLNVSYMPNITGLGTTFDKKGILLNLIIKLYKVSIPHARCVFFQNDDNIRILNEHKIKFGRYRLIPGSGVNVNKFVIHDYPPNDKMSFVYMARIKKEKGCLELTEAARIITQKYPNVEFHILGIFEYEYSYLEKEWSAMDRVYYHGYQNDIRPFLKSAHALVHPSYEEGMSNTCLEASAMGRPIIASNIPGCREIFDDGKTGIAIKPRNVASLVAGIERFIKLPYEEKKTMGIKAAHKVRKQFNRNIVVNAYLDEIGRL